MSTCNLVVDVRFWRRPSYISVAFQGCLSENGLPTEVQTLPGSSRDLDRSGPRVVKEISSSALVYTGTGQTGALSAAVSIIISGYQGAIVFPLYPWDWTCTSTFKHV